MRPTEQVSGPTRVAIAAGFIAMVGLFGGYALLFAFDSSAWTAQDVGYFGSMAIATGLCATRAILVPYQRIAWSLMTVVLFGNLVAELLYYYLELPFPSAADAIWLLTYPLMLAALIALVAPMVGTERRALLLLDWIIATLTVSALAVLLFLPAIFEAQPDTSLGSVISVAYPVADILIVSAIVVVLFTGARRNGPAIGLVVAAGLVWLVSDAIYSYQTAVGIGEEGSLLDLTWPVALGLLATAAWAPAMLEIDRRTLLRRAGLLSGICVLAALLVLVLREYSESQYLVAFFLAIGAVAGGGVRLILAQRENRRLLAAANTDPLTGIPSRAKLSSDSSAHDGGPVTVAMLDLDGFKFYNDSFGHTAGDVLLERIATRLVRAAGDRGEVYRIGGDEFCVVLPGEASGNRPVLGRLRRATHISGEGFDITASLGYAECPAEAPDIPAALAVADERMYVQKNGTRTSARGQVHEVLVRSLREREPELAAHTGRVRDLAVAVAQQMVTDPEELDVIERAAELHDVGKVAIPDSILIKPGPLEPDEWELMKQHTIVGERIISASAALAPVGRLVRYSHEHYDGAGYPDGLAGEAIPLGSRIILACDALEAMTNDRPYSRVRPLPDALDELRQGAGSQFDPEVVRTLIDLVTSGRVNPMGEGEQPLRSAVDR